MTLPTHLTNCPFVSADDANIFYTSDDVNYIESVMNCEMTRVLNYCFFLEFVYFYLPTTIYKLIYNLPKGEEKKRESYNFQNNTQNDLLKKKKTKQYFKLKTKKTN